MSDTRCDAPDHLRVALAQMQPVWLQRDATLDRVVDFIARAGQAEAGLVAFGEALVPGYPFWLEHTDAARFESPLQKDMYAHYLDQAVQIEAGHLRRVCEAAADTGITVVLGCIERPQDRGGHSVYASMVTIDDGGQVCNVHRKLQPTHEERLSWSPGDGHGLRCRPLGAFTLGGLNCWENWMPLPRAALYGQGEDLHVAIWPGNQRNTRHITRFIAAEGRSYVLSVCGLLARSAIPDDLAVSEALAAVSQEWLADGGSCIATPDGEWLVEPVAGREQLIIADLDHAAVRRARHSFDPAGHYSRPDVTRLLVNRRRQSTVETDNG